MGPLLLAIANVLLAGFCLVQAGINGAQRKINRNLQQIVDLHQRTLSIHQGVLKDVLRQEPSDS